MDYEFVVKLASGILTLLAGFGGFVPVMNWLKKMLNLSGRRAQLGAVALAVVFAILTGIAQGKLVPESFTAEQFVTTVGIVLAISQAEYARYLRNRNISHRD